MLPVIKEQESIKDIMGSLMDITEFVPFWNSDYQNRKVVIWWQLTPERAYRHSALRIQNRLNALNECYFSLKENELKIKRLTREIDRLNNENPIDYDIDIEMKQIEIDKFNSSKPLTEKLIKDAIQEINSLSPIINSMGKITKEQFENWEEEHFKQIHMNMIEWKNDHILALETLNNEEDLYLQIINNSLTNNILW